MDCVFCKIIKGELPGFKIYEDKDTFAFLSIANDYYGHTLVIPKKHCESILDADEQTLTAVMNTARKISKHYVENLGFDGANVFINNGAAADQVVFHLHVHIAPRKAKTAHNWGGNIKRDLKAEQQFLTLALKS